MWSDELQTDGSHVWKVASICLVLNVTDLLTKGAVHLPNQGIVSRCEAMRLEKSNNVPMWQSQKGCAHMHQLSVAMPIVSTMV